ncbi:MAG: ATP-binding protein [Bacteroidota bacterium]
MPTPQTTRPEKKRVVLSWSSGKDSAWALHLLRQQPDVEVTALVTTFNQVADRAAMHATRRTLVEAQAEAAGLPLVAVPLPWPCTNDEYERRTVAALAPLHAAGATHVAFGDLFLEDVRAYRERLLAPTGLKPLFPLWHPPGGTQRLAREMVDGGLRATLTCVDPKQLDPACLGRLFDATLWQELPPSCDLCGENGEFHTFCHAGPMFAHDISIEAGIRVERDGFWFLDLCACTT